VQSWQVRGRGAETKTLDQIVGLIQAGGGAVVLVEGPAGIGKTRLITDALVRAETAGVATSYGRCDEIDTMAPLSPLLAALSGGTVPILRREELRALERPGDQRFWLLEELSELLEMRSRQQPRLVALDDLQWADPATAWATQALTERLYGVPIGWVIASRPHPVASAGSRLVAALAKAGATRVTLAPLDAEDVNAIAGDVLGGAPDDALRHYLAGAGGNPFLTLELLRILEADGTVMVARGAAVLTDAGVPRRFRETVRLRLAGLSPAAIRLLRAGSVFGRPFAAGEVAAVLNEPAGSLVASLSEAIDADVLVDAEGLLAFRHDLIRQAILDDTPASLRTLLHRQTATVVLGGGRSANEAASHLLASAQPGDEEAAGVLFRAAVEIAAQTPAAAADLALRAIELMSPAQPGWSEAVVGTVSLLAWATRFVDAERLAASARSQGLGRDASAAMRLAITDMLMLSARRIELIDACRDALAQPDLTPSMRGHFLHNLGNGYVTNAQPQMARQTFEQALALAAPDDGALTLSIRIGLAHVELAGGRVLPALDQMQELVGLCVAYGPEGKQRMPWLLYATLLAAADRFDDADRAFADARVEAEALGATWAVEFTQRIVTAARWWAGRIPDAVAEAEATMSLIEAIDLGHDADVPLGILALAAVHANDLEDARRFLERAGDRRYAFSVPQYLQLADAMLCDVEHDRIGSVMALRRLTERGDALLATLAQEPTLAPVYTRMALRANAREIADQVVATVEDVATSNPTLRSHQVAARHAGGLLRGDADWLVAAADEARLAPRLLARASALEDCGRVLLERGNASESARRLNEALDIYSSIAASRDETRVRASLRAAGIRRRPQSPRARAAPDKSPLAPLTSAERRVVRLVTEGLTNREIGERLYLSPYTVGTHLKHVFDKLSVSSRVELTRMAVAAPTS
jgi:DNA-binding CsgD family transcriptional regulator/tetratricopeptide (TPR) repeat protein